MKPTFAQEVIHRQVEHDREDLSELAENMARELKVDGAIRILLKELGGKCSVLDCVKDLLVRRVLADTKSQTEAARMLGVSKRVINYWVHDQCEIPVSIHGGRGGTTLIDELEGEPI